jgi:hypothetical protein
MNTTIFIREWVLFIIQTKKVIKYVSIQCSPISEKWLFLEGFQARLSW